MKVSRGGYEGIEQDMEVSGGKVSRVSVKLKGVQADKELSGQASQADRIASKRKRWLAKENLRCVKQPGIGLYWLRCRVGREWTGRNCTGRTRSMSWSEALKACPVGYRLPTKQELVLLLDGCNSGVKSGRGGRCNSCEDSSKCSSMFGEDTGDYWSSTPSHSKPDHAWIVRFDPPWGAWHVIRDKESSTKDARCVRGDRFRD